MKKMILLSALILLPKVIFAAPQSTEPQSVTLKASVVVRPIFPGFSEVHVAQGELVSATSGLEIERVKQMVSMGFGASHKSDSGVVVKTCKSALLTVSAGPGNFIPTQEEVYYAPQVLSFVCNDAIVDYN